MIKVVICDFDDTLVSERKFVDSGFDACAEFLAGYGFDKRALKKTMWGEFEKSHAQIFDRLLSGLPEIADSALLGKLVDIYRYHTPKITFEDDVSPFLEELKKRELKSAIVTDGDSRTQHNKLDAVGAEKFFDKVVATYDFGLDWKKPSAKAFRHLGDFFGADFAEMLYIGDNPHKDFAMRAEIPIATARILRDGAIHNYPDYRDGIKEMFAIKSLPEIFGLPIFK